MEDTGLGGIVSSLHLREVDDVTTHGSSSHEATVGEVFEGLSIKVGTLLLLSLPMGRSSLGAVEGTVQVNAHDLRIVRERALNHRTLSPRDTSIGNEDVQAAVEVLDALVDGFLHSSSIGDVTLVCLGWNRMLAVECESNQGLYSLKHTLNVMFLCNLSRTLRTFGVGVVPHGNISTSLSKTMSHLETNASTRTSDNSSFALQGEHAQQAGVSGRSGVLVDEVSSIVDGIVRHSDESR